MRKFIITLALVAAVTVPVVSVAAETTPAPEKGRLSLAPTLAYNPAKDSGISAGILFHSHDLGAGLSIWGGGPKGPSDGNRNGSRGGGLDLRIDIDEALALGFKHFGNLEYQSIAKDYLAAPGPLSLYGEIGGALNFSNAPTYATGVAGPPQGSPNGEVSGGATKAHFQFGGGGGVRYRFQFTKDISGEAGLGYHSIRGVQSHFGVRF